MRKSTLPGVVHLALILLVAAAFGTLVFSLANSNSVLGKKTTKGGGPITSPCPTTKSISSLLRRIFKGGSPVCPTPKPKPSPYSSPPPRRSPTPTATASASPINRNYTYNFAISMLDENRGGVAGVTVKIDITAQSRAVMHQEGLVIPSTFPLTRTTDKTGVISLTSVPRRTYSVTIIGISPTSPYQLADGESSSKIFNPNKESAVFFNFVHKNPNR